LPSRCEIGPCPQAYRSGGCARQTVG
jgi:hypothetical protein